MVSGVLVKFQRPGCKTQEVGSRQGCWPGSPVPNCPPRATGLQQDCPLVHFPMPHTKGPYFLICPAVHTCRKNSNYSNHILAVTADSSLLLVSFSHYLNSGGGATLLISMTCHWFISWAVTYYCFPEASSFQKGLGGSRGAQLWRQWSPPRVPGAVAPEEEHPAPHHT